MKSNEATVAFFIAFGAAGLPPRGGSPVLPPRLGGGAKNFLAHSRALQRGFQLSALHLSGPRSARRWPQKRGVRERIRIPGREPGGLRKSVPAEGSGTLFVDPAKKCAGSAASAAASEQDTWSGWSADASHHKQLCCLPSSAALLPPPS